MKSKLLFGAAGIALFAATGATQAADVPMIAAATTTPATPVATGGPAIEFTLSLNNWYEFAPCCDWDIEFEFEGVVDFQNPAGWGFQLLGYQGYEPGDYYYDLGLRAYRGFGGGTLGLYVLTDDLFDWTDLEVGVDTEFSFGNLTVYNDTYAHFDAFHMHSDTVVEFVINRLTVYGEIDVRFFDGPFEIEYVEVGAEFDLGNITPYAYVHWEPGTPFWGFDIGAEFERQIGTGPFTLIGHADIGIHPGFFNDVEASIGVRYAPQEVNSPWWW